MSLRRRSSTAVVGAAAPVPSIADLHRCAIDRASQASSSATVANRPYRTSPGGASRVGRSSPTSTGASGPVRIELDTALARLSTDGGLRKLVSSDRVTAGAPDACGKSVTNRGRFDADAPRQE